MLDKIKNYFTNFGNSKKNSEHNNETLEDKFPKSFLINRYEDYHTHYIGDFKNTNQFLIYQTFAFMKPFDQIKDEDWKEFRHEYVVSFIFDSTGNLRNHDYLNAGSTKEFKQDEIDNWINNKLSELENYKFSNIQIKPFKISIDSIDFGLIPNYESGMIEMQPSNTIAFSAPWNGEYDT